MSRKLSKLLILAPAVMCLFMGSKFFDAGAAWQDLPEGPGADIARDRCTTCHEADLIRSQRLTRQGWTREVDKMIRWGAVVPDAEKDKLIDYLAMHFPVRAAQPGGSLDRGKEVFEARCTLCHESDLTEQQRLTRQGWTREVDKMIRWGATVPDEEKAPLIDYLSANFGLRPLKR
ncbi:MAG: hypothetical protein IPM66_18300 [Acidobacteriota bacterium]|nr:MAG: hypothetical protein IPM66_18300 [Acidobacteriota bacterium]